MDEFVVAGLHFDSMNHLMAFGGWWIGVCFGAVCLISRFCLNGAMLEWVGEGDQRRLRSFVLAMGVALVGTQWMEWQGWIDLSQASYRSGVLLLGGALLGGFAFGAGMILANGCPTRHLVRFGAGDARSLVAILATAIVGYMTMRGLFSVGRVHWNNLTQYNLADAEVPTQSVLEWLTYWSQGDLDLLRTTLLVFVGLSVLVWCFKSAPFRQSPTLWLGGGFVGLLILAAWSWTGILGQDEFEPAPMEGVSFIGPLGNALQYLMTYTGSTIDFGIALALGAPLGSLLAAATTGRFRRQGFTEPGEFRDRLLGGAIMGFGGVVAGGCTIGQALSGFSTLSLGSLLSTGAIFLGAWVATQIRTNKGWLASNGSPGSVAGSLRS